jgi:4-aminobutyrate aminotransferase / (S)-3-amino-2-methylpropionate transaminase / 5-aminovalerate transaminase
MQAMEFVDANGSTYAPAAKKLVQHCPHQGVLVLTGTYDNIIRLLMPLTITDEEYEEALQVQEGGLRVAATELGELAATR